MLSGLSVLRMQKTKLIYIKCERYCRRVFFLRLKYVKKCVQQQQQQQQRQHLGLNCSEHFPNTDSRCQEDNEEEFLIRPLKNKSINQTVFILAKCQPFQINSMNSSARMYFFISCLFVRSLRASVCYQFPQTSLATLYSVI